MLGGMQRRFGRFSAVHIEGVAQATVSAHIDRLGFGRYQYLIITAIGLTMVAECMELGATGPLTAALGHAYDLTPTHRAELLMSIYMAEGVGLLAAGLICDLLGRRGLLIWSTAGSLVTLLAIAVLPVSIGFGWLMVLRAASGITLGMMSVATSVLVVESCPTASRPVAMFSIGFIANFGYLGTALGLSAFMPGFGEEALDEWRQFCLVMCLPFLLGLVSSCCFLVESPHFLAVRGSAASCVQALEHMGRVNGQFLQLPAGRLPSPQQQEQQQQQQRKDGLGAKLQGELGRILTSVLLFPGLLALLVTMDSCRTYFTAGVAYVSKDIFVAVGSQSVPGTSLYTVASLSPFVGILIASPLIKFGTRFIVLGSALLGAAAVWMLTLDALRGAPLLVLALVMTAKFTFSPMNACISLMKVEAFPTEVRGSMLAMMHFLAKIACMAAPTLEELLRGGSKDAWSHGGLDLYLRSLCVAVLLCGFLALSVPASLGQGQELLEDFVPSKEEAAAELEGLRSSSGSGEEENFDIWCEAGRRRSTLYGAAATSHTSQKA